MLNLIPEAILTIEGNKFLIMYLLHKEMCRVTSRRGLTRAYYEVNTTSVNKV